MEDGDDLLFNTGEGDIYGASILTSKRKRNCTEFPFKRGRGRGSILIWAQLFKANDVVS